MNLPHRPWSAKACAPVFGPVALVLALSGAGFSSPAVADDRPFLRTTSAIVEDDDERVFEVSASVRAGQKMRGVGLQLEYSFSPTLSMELEWGGTRHKTGGESASERGLGLWVAWVDPARDDWGLATKFSVERERESGEGWARPEWKGVLAFSLPLAEKSVWVHANLGLRYQSAEPGDHRWAGLWSVAVQKDLTRHTVLFAEAAGAQGGSDRLAQVGVRQWLRREKVALDVGLGRQFDADRRGNFLALGLSFYDLSP